MLRVGTVPYLVARPLTEGLGRLPGVELRVAPPAELGRDLAQGRLDVALASSILSLENPEWRLWEEGPLIAAPRAVRSVLLFLRPGLCGPNKVQSLILDPNSRTGAALARILLRDAYAAEFEERTAPPGSDPFRLGADAVQRIGDPALEAVVDHPEWECVDLGVTWNDLTRLPFIYAGWIGSSGFDPASAAGVLLPAAERGLARREAYVDEGVRSLGLERQFLRRYLFEDMAYRLPGAVVRASLAEFGARHRRNLHPTTGTGIR
ncbi:MAG: hypothetical protein EYC70_16085 [Planctomycetota bacterium]|nr:MAG: hypothetical protein EYC70_16085 [Planctomycetota bacterium]